MIGLTFFLVGLIDAASAWLPLQLGESEWELGTTSQFFDIFPLLGLGIALPARRGRSARPGSGRRGASPAFCILVAVFMWLALALYAHRPSAGLTKIPTRWR